MLSKNQTEQEDFMNKAKRYLCGFAVLAGLFVIGSRVRSPESQAKGAYSSPVTVLHTSSAPANASLVDNPTRIAHPSQHFVIGPTNQVQRITFTVPAVP